MKWILKLCVYMYTVYTSLSACDNSESRKDPNDPLSCPCQRPCPPLLHEIGSSGGVRSYRPPQLATKATKFWTTRGHLHDTNPNNALFSCLMPPKKGWHLIDTVIDPWMSKDQDSPNQKWLVPNLPIFLHISGIQKNSWKTIFLSFTTG